MDEALNRDLYEQLVRGIADGRRKNDAEVLRLIDDGPFLPEDALRAGLVDDVAYEDQVEDKLRSLPARGEKSGAPAVSAARLRKIEGDDYARVSAAAFGLNKGPRIGVIYATGTINAGRSGYDPIYGAVVGADSLIESIRQARRDSSLRAIVIRIDSPGVGHGVRRDLARAHDRQERSRRSADRRVDVRSGRVGRVHIALPPKSSSRSRRR
jgi:protease-4